MTEVSCKGGSQVRQIKEREFRDDWWVKHRTSTQNRRKETCKSFILTIHLNPDDDLHQNITEQFWSIIVWFIYRQTSPNKSKHVQTFNLLQRHWLGHLWPLTLRPAACMRVMDVPNRNQYSGPFYVIFTNSHRSCQFWCRFSSLDVKKSRLNMQNSWDWPPTVSTGPCGRTWSLQCFHQLHHRSWGLFLMGVDHSGVTLHLVNAQHKTLQPVILTNNTNTQTNN